jgi:hypothetical protein
MTRSGAGEAGQTRQRWGRKMAKVAKKNSMSPNDHKIASKKHRASKKCKCGNRKKVGADMCPYCAQEV